MFKTFFFSYFFVFLILFNREEGDKFILHDILVYLINDSMNI